MIVHLRRLWIQLTANRRQFGIFCAMLGVGLLLWARLIIVSHMPRTALADENSDQLATASLNDEEMLSDKNSRVMQTVQLDDIPRRDPFSVNPAYFPQITSLEKLAHDGGKSPVKTAEDSEMIERRLVGRLRELVAQFALEAVMWSNPPTVIISGQTYAPGDFLPVVGNEQIRFQLVDLNERSVILQWEDRKFELRMTPPGR